MRKKLFRIFIAWMVLIAQMAVVPVAKASPGTYYIDYATGSNSNPGTKLSPWKSSPGMQTAAGCAGATPTYTPVAGDQFNFKGGVTWPRACFSLSIANSGTSANQMYWGVDLTWFTGGSFTRPIFDMANGTPNGNSPIKIRAQWITLDNIEVKRYLIVSGIGECADANIDAGTSASGNVTIKNMYIHDWTITALVNGSTSHGTGSICQNGASGPIDVDTVTMSDAATTAVVPFGACFRNLHEIKNSDCEHTGEGEVGLFGPIHNNVFANINGNAVDAHDNQNHTNILEIGSGETVLIYQNLIHNTSSGVTIYVCGKGSIYDNVFWQDSNQYIKLSGQSGGVCGSNLSSDVMNVYNNTADCSNGNNCFGVDAKGTMAGTVNLKNNHWITNGAATCYNNLPNCSAITTINDIANETMSTATATTQGYTVASKYQAAGDTTTFVGVNLTSVASGALAALSIDAEGTTWFGASAVARPTGSTKWNPGTYQSPFSGGGTPPTVSAAVAGTGCPGACAGQVTITVTASGGTVSSVQPLVDGATFGNACTSSPCSVLWNTTKVGNGAHTVGGTATNGTGQGTATPVSVTVNNSTPGCTTSGATWTATSFTTQSGAFTAGGSPMTITPNGIPGAGTGGPVFALSQNPMGTFTDGAALVRQSDNGFWEAYNGAISGYSHTAAVSWIVGTPMTPLLAVDTVGQTYSVQVMQNGVTSTIATGYTFRQPATSLSYWNLSPTTPTLTVCNFALGATGALTPTSFNFGTLQVGTNASQVFTLTNNGGSPLTVSAYTASPSVFSIIANGCVSPIAAGANCPITVQFAPAAPTTYSGTLHLTTTGTINDATLSGAGSSISVPSVPTGLTATATGSTIALAWTASTGTAPITYNVSRSVNNGGPYSSIVTGLTSPAYSDTNLAPGTYYYVVSATNAAGSSANSAQASATVAGAPQVNLSPASLVFGAVQFGSSGSLNLTVANVGSGNLILDASNAVPPASGPNAADFTATPTCTNGQVIAVGGSCPILWTFTPSTTAGESATGCVVSNSPTSPDCVTMTGNGIGPITIAPSSLVFGNIYLNKTSSAQVVTYTNNSGATVTFSSIALATGTQFAISANTCGGSVANGANCTVSVTATPTVAGLQSDTLIFTDTAAGSPHNLALTVNGRSHHVKKVL